MKKVSEIDMLEPNKIYNMDCLDGMKQLDDNSIDLIVTDPPYGIDYQSNMRVVSDKFKKMRNDDNDSRFKIYNVSYNLLKKDTVAVIFCSFKNYAKDYISLEKKFKIRNAIIWYKGGGGIGDLEHSLLTDYEIALICHKGGKKINGKRIGSVWKIKKINPNDMVHPTEKPHILIEKLIEYFSKEGDVVLDPFIGSGTTAVACKKLNRNFIGFEISEEYCDIANKRLANVPERLDKWF